MKTVARSKLFQVDRSALKRRADEQDGFRTIELEAGDLPYLPRGLFHRATARDAVSVRLSFGIYRPSGVDFLELVVQRLIRDPAAREYAPRLHPDDGHAAIRAYLDTIMRKVEELGHGDALRAEFLEDYARK